MALTAPAEQAVVRAAIEATDRGDVADAARRWRQALALIPQEGQVALNLGFVCFQAGNLQAAALPFAVAAVTLAPDDRAAALNGLAAVERGRGRFGRAQRWLERALALLPADPYLWSNHADLARVRALNEIAYRSIRRGLALAPDYVDIQYNYLLVLRVLPPAMRAAASSSLANSSDRRIRTAIPSLLAAAGDHEGALAAAESAGRLFPDDGALALETGRIHFALGAAGAAARFYRRAVGLAPALRKSRGALREIVLVSERDLAAMRGGPADGPDDRYAQYLVHADEALVLKESWATILPDGRCYLRRFIPASQGSVQHFAHAVFLHQERMLTTIPDGAKQRGPSGAVLIGGCPNFSHWLNDWSSKLRLVMASDDLRDRPLVVDDRLPKVAHDLMRALGVDMGLLHPQRAAASDYRDLWLPSMSHRYQEMPPAHAAWIRARLAVPARPPGRPRRLFMSRRNARYRRIANMAEVEPIIRRFGLEEVHPETMTLAAQLELFSEAELWVGVLGGGSASILLCPATCHVVELAHRRMVLGQYEGVTRTIGQTFSRVVGDVVRLDNSPDYDFDWDVVVPVDELERTLREALG